jgi:hypothetical protein
MDFSPEGSVAANCHGWANNLGPIGDYVQLMANGSILTEEERKSYIGLWGLTGEFEVNNYATVDNYKIQTITTHGSAEELCDLDYQCSMLNIHLDNRWDVAIVNAHYNDVHENPVRSKLEDKVNPIAPFLVRYFPRLRMFAQKYSGIHRISSRNELLYTSVKHFTWPNQELVEFFIPVSNVSHWIESAQPLIKELDVFNTTVRHVNKSSSSLLSYCENSDVRGFVMLCNKFNSHQKSIYRFLIDMAYEMGGSYYLPYNQYATVAQFERCYPRHEEVADKVTNPTNWSKKYLGI